MSNKYQAMNIPPAANERGGFEFLRCAIIDGELHLTLRPVFNQPDDWGRSFAENAHQDRFPEAETLTRISSAFEAEMKAPPGHDSTVGPIG